MESLFNGLGRVAGTFDFWTWGYWFMCLPCGILSCVPPIAPLICHIPVISVPHHVEPPRPSLETMDEWMDPSETVGPNKTFQYKQFDLLTGFVMATESQLIQRVAVISNAVLKWFCQVPTCQADLRILHHSIRHGTWK